MRSPFSFASLTRNQRLVRVLTALVCIAIVALAPTVTVSAPTNWTNAGGGNWDDADNWSNDVPSSSDDPTIDNGGTAKVNDANAKDGRIITIGRTDSGAVDQSEGNLTAHFLLMLGQQQGSSGSYDISGGTFSSVIGPGMFPPLPTGEIIVGDRGKGMMNVGAQATVQSEGTIYIGRNGGGQGTFTTSGIVSSQADIFVGQLGNGTLNVNGGTVSAIGHINLGVEDDETGIVGIGEATQTAGFVNPFRLNVGGNTEMATGVEGTYTFSGGTIQAGLMDPDNFFPGEFELGANVEIGKDGLGLFIMSDGMMQVNESLRLGEEGDGTVEMSGGVINTELHVNIADRGTGLFEQTGGTVNAGTWVEIGAKDFGEGRRSNGTYRLTGGVLNTLADFEGNNGPIHVGRNGDALFEVGPNGIANVKGNLVAALETFGNGVVTTSGALNVDGEIIIGLAELGEMNIHGGVVNSGKAFKVGQGTKDFPGIPRGTVNQTSGTVNVGGWVELGSMDGATGAYNLSGGTLNSLGTDPDGEGDVNVGRDGRGTFEQTGGVLNVNGTLNVEDDSSYQLAGGKLNMNGGDINLGPSAEFNFTDGQLANIGTFMGNITQNGGTLSPGASAGTTMVEGNYMMNDGTLDIEIGGLAQDEHDVLAVSDELAIDGGTLAVSFIGGYFPDEGDVFTILTFGGTSGGGFSGFDLPLGEWDTSELLVTGDMVFVSGSGFIIGDMDCDGDVDFDDIDDFVLGLQDAAAYEAIFGLPPSVKGDTDGDGDLDFDDIPEFVRIISGGGGLQSVPEPATLGLLLTGLLVVAGVRRGGRIKSRAGPQGFRL